MQFVFLLSDRSVPHYCAAQLLSCRYEDLRELFVTFSILFSGGKPPVPPPHPSLPRGARTRVRINEHYAKRDFRLARCNYVPGARLLTVVDTTTSHYRAYFTLRLLVNPATLYAPGLPDINLDDRALQGRVVCLLLGAGEESTRQSPAFPSSIVYGFVLQVLNPNPGFGGRGGRGRGAGRGEGAGRGSGDIIIEIGLPSAAALDILSREVADQRAQQAEIVSSSTAASSHGKRHRGQCVIDLLFLTSCLHNTLWPKLQSLTRLLPNHMRPRDCQTHDLAPLPQVILSLFLSHLHPQSLLSYRPFPPPPLLNLFIFSLILFSFFLFPPMSYFSHLYFRRLLEATSCVHGSLPL